MHLKGFPGLVNDPSAQREVTDFIDRHTRPGGDVVLPSGVHVIDFHATDHPARHLPDELR